MTQGSSLLPSIYNPSLATGSASEQLSRQDAMHHTLASLIKIVELVFLNPRPELAPVFFSTCQWVSQGKRCEVANIVAI